MRVIFLVRGLCIFHRKRFLAPGLLESCMPDLEKVVRPCRFTLESLMIIKKSVNLLSPPFSSTRTSSVCWKMSTDRYCD